MKRKIPSTVALALSNPPPSPELCASRGPRRALTRALSAVKSAPSKMTSGCSWFDRVRKQVTLTNAGTEHSRNISANLSQLELHTRSTMANKGRRWRA